MLEKYFEVDEKRSWLEDFLFDHAYNDDINAFERTDISFNAVYAFILLLILIAVAF